MVKKVIIKENIFKILRNIIILKIKEDIYITELAKRLNINKRHPDLRKAIKLMEVNNIVTRKLSLAPYKMLNINNHKLESYIRNNSQEFKKWGEFIEATKTSFEKIGLIIPNFEK